jgi:hypothetical protein
LIAKFRHTQVWSTHPGSVRSPHRSEARLSAVANQLLDLFIAADSEVVNEALFRGDLSALSEALEVDLCELGWLLQEISDTAFELMDSEGTSFGGSNPPLSVSVTTWHAPPAAARRSAAPLAREARQRPEAAERRMALGCSPALPAC